MQFPCSDSFPLFVPCLTHLATTFSPPSKSTFSCSRWRSPKQAHVPLFPLIFFLCSLALQNPWETHSIRQDRNHLYVNGMTLFSPFCRDFRINFSLLLYSSSKFPLLSFCLLPKSLNTHLFQFSSPPVHQAGLAFRTPQVQTDFLNQFEIVHNTRWLILQFSYVYPHSYPVIVFLNINVMGFIHKTNRNEVIIKNIYNIFFLGSVTSLSYLYLPLSFIKHHNIRPLMFQNYTYFHFLYSFCIRFLRYVSITFLVFRS